MKMNKRMPCEVIQDLLPSYIDEITNDVTNSVVSDHINDCAECRKVLDAMRGIDISVPDSGSVPDPEEKIEINFLKKQRRKSVFLFFIISAIIVVFLIFFAVYSHNVKATADLREILAASSSGDTFSFGRYEQDGDIENGPEEIVWTVLQNRNGQVFAMSKYGLEHKYFNDVDEAVTWENCSLRQWLNNDFYDTAFNDSEKMLITETELSNPDNPYYFTEGGEATIDKVSLIPGGRAERLTMDITVCFPTPHAIENGVYADYETGRCECWTRLPGIRENTSSIINTGGYADTIGYNVTSTGVAVRPCIYITY